MLSERGTQWVIGMLEEIEREIAELYGAYREAVPQMAAFWERLQRDELRHSSWITDLTPLVRDGKLQADGQRANPDVYQAFSEYLYDETHRARKQPITARQALTTAHYVESSYLEKHLLDVFVHDDTELNKLMRALTTDTERHARIVKEALDNLVEA
jgi:hypothetical protein